VTKTPVIIKEYFPKAKRLDEIKTSTSLDIMIEKDKERYEGKYINIILTQTVSHHLKIKLSAGTSFLLGKHANVT
jgi:hypothetical protein